MGIKVGEVFRVELESQVYFPGQTVKGAVIVKFNEEILVKGIRVKCAGKGRVSWDEGSGDDKSSYSKSAKFYSMEQYVLGDGRGQFGLEPREHVFRFSFTVPNNLQTSIKHFDGDITHYVKAIVELPGTLTRNHRLEQPFTINNFSDLNLWPSLVDGRSSSDQKTFCCLFCRSGPINATVAVTKCGVVPGDLIFVTVDIDNLSNDLILAARIKFVQVLTFHSTFKTKTETRVAIDEKLGPNDGFMNLRSENLRLEVPCVPPTSTKLESIPEKERLIDVEYFMRLEVVPRRGLSRPLTVEVPVTVGSIPFISEFDRYKRREGKDPVDLPNCDYPDLPSITFETCCLTTKSSRNEDYPKYIKYSTTIE